LISSRIAVDEPEARTWFLPTLRNNAIGMLTAGLVVPAAGLVKYTDDLLGVSPSRLLLTRKGIDKSWLQAIPESPTDFPVLLELQLPATVQPTPFMPDETVAAPCAVLPASQVRSMHFRSESELEEFRARSFGNLDPGLVSARVSQEIFDSRLPAWEDVVRWLSELPVEDRLTALIADAERIGGVLALAGALPTPTVDSLDERGELLRGLLTMVDPDRNPTELVIDAIATPAWMNSELSADRTLLSGIFRVLARHPPGAHLGAQSLLREIRSEALGLAAAADIAEIEVNLDRVEAIVGAQAPLRPLKPLNGLRSAKSLLLFALRDDPEEALSWVTDMPSDPLSVEGACLLAGFASTLRRLPTQLRGGPLLPVIEELCAERINRALRTSADVTADSQARTIEVLRLAAAERNVFVLRVGGIELFRLDEPVERVTAEIRQQSAIDHGSPTAVAGADSHETEPILAEFLKAASRKNARTKKYLVELAQARGWPETVVTVVEFGDASYSVQGTEIHVDGTPNVRLEMRHERLRHRLEALSAEELRALLESLPRPAKTKSAPRGSDASDEVASDQEPEPHGSP
jgi:hypothetical protein